MAKRNSDFRDVLKIIIIKNNYMHAHTDYVAARGAQESRRLLLRER